MVVKIRIGKPTDADKIWDIEKESREHHKKITSKKYSLLNMAEVSEKNKKEFAREFKRYLRKKETFTFVAEENKVIVGYIHASFRKWGWSDSPPYCTKIDDLGILKTYRRKGIAKKLIKKVEETTKKKKVKFIYLNVWKSNVPAINLYSKLKYDKFMVEMVKKIK